VLRDQSFRPLGMTASTPSDMPFADSSGIVEHVGDVKSNEDFPDRVQLYSSLSFDWN